MKKLADHFTIRRKTSRIQELKKIHQSERTRKIVAKHKWYLKERHGMITSVPVPEFYHGEILSIAGILAITTLMCIAVQVSSYNTDWDVQRHIDTPLPLLI